MPENQYVKVNFGEVASTTPPENAPAHRVKATVGWLAFLRNAAINLFVFGLVVVILTITVIEMFRKPVIIEEIGLPPPLSDLGYSGSVAANRLWDAIQDIQNKSGTIKPQTLMQTSTRQLDVVEPGSGISLQSLTQMLRQLFGLQQIRIAGEFICGDPDCTQDKLALRLRVISDEGIEVLPGKPMGNQSIDLYFQASALSLLEKIDPYVVAAYYDEIGNLPESIRIANDMITSNHQHAAWAANLIANQQQNNEQYEASIKSYELSTTMAAAHKITGFAIPWNGWGVSLAKLERHEKALDKFERATIEDNDFAPAWLNWGISLAELGDHKAAIEKFEAAIQKDSKDASAWLKWGLSLAVLGHHKAAIEKFEEAIQRDHDSSSAWFNRGLSLARLERYSEAIENIKISIEMKGEPAADWLISLVLQKRYDEAEEKFKETVKKTTVQSVRAGVLKPDGDKPQKTAK